MQTILMFPKDKPVVRDLSSYYLDIGRLIEHYQAELGSGAIHLKSPSAAGVVFFDETNILNVTYQDRQSLLDGKTARNRLIEALESGSFSVSVYRIDADKLFFWANLHHAEDFYQNLASEFTDLLGLIKKMTSLKLTGYVKVSTTKQSQNGFVFFNNGGIIGISCSWDPENHRKANDNLERLVRHAKTNGGTFNVKLLDLNNIVKNLDENDNRQRIPADLLDMIHELLLIFDRLVSAKNEIRVDFYTLLRKKFIQKADVFDFLDPFTGEFSFTPRTRSNFPGNAAPQEFIDGIVKSVRELAQDLDMADALHRQLDNWRRTYAASVEAFGIEL